MQFLKNFYRSLFDIDWLREQRHARTRSALGFLFVTVMLVTVLQVGPIVGFILPKGLDLLNKKIAADVPDFSLTMKNNELTAEKIPQPFTYKFTGEEGTFTLLIDTVSTSTPTVASLVANNDTDMAVVLTKNTISYLDQETKESKTEKFTEFPDGTITKSDVTTSLDAFQNKWLIPVAIGLLVVSVIAMYAGRMFMLVLWTSLAFFVVKSKKLEWTWSEIYRVGAYASTLPLLLSPVFMFLGLSMIPAATLAFAVLLYLVLFPQNTKPVV